MNVVCIELYVQKALFSLPRGLEQVHSGASMRDCGQVWVTPNSGFQGCNSLLNSIITQQ